VRREQKKGRNNADEQPKQEWGQDDALAPLSHVWTALVLTSLSSEQMDSSTLLMVSAGDQLSLRMSRQIPPWAFTLQ
jgi:hypothetical protein